jgi:hypothetical protein
MLHCGGERSISYQVSQLLVNLLDLYAGRVAYPIDEPESVEAKTTIDEVSGRDGRELPTLKCVDDNRAARFKRFCQLAHGSSTHHIEDEAKFLSVESLLNILVKVVALEDYAVTSPLPHLFGSFFPPDDIQCLDACKLCERNDVLPHGRIGQVTGTLSLTLNEDDLEDEDMEEDALTDAVKHAHHSLEVDEIEIPEEG